METINEDIPSDFTTDPTDPTEPTEPAAEPAEPAAEPTDPTEPAAEPVAEPAADPAEIADPAAPGCCCPSLPSATSVNIVEFFSLPHVATPTIRMTFDVACHNQSRRFQTEVRLETISDPMTPGERDGALATGWDQVEPDVGEWAHACQTCPVGKAFDIVTKKAVV